MSDQRQTEGVLSFVPSQPASRIQHGVELGTRGQLAFFSGDAVRDVVQLFAIGQLVLDYHEQLFQLHRNADDR